MYCELFEATTFVGKIALATAQAVLARVYIDAVEFLLGRESMNGILSVIRSCRTEQLWVVD